MRGKGCMFCCSPAKVGITPAYSGKSLLCMDFCPAYRDHPRVCGEKKLCPHLVISQAGSPPRVRGKAGWPLCGLPCIGITPACAGKSARILKRRTEKRDHPRVCGEKYYVTVGKADHEGSPPRMRGKVRAAPLGAGDAGITPAYAGKSQPWRSYSQRRWDHPRVCGEKHTNISVRPIPPGSPPRMRGKVVHFFGAHLPDGITPAYAGKSQHDSHSRER